VRLQVDHLRQRVLPGSAGLPPHKLRLGGFRQCGHVVLGRSLVPLQGPRLGCGIRGFALCCVAPLVALRRWGRVGVAGPCTSVLLDER